MTAGALPAGDLLGGMSESVDFQITSAMVDEFAELIGDYSSLHMDKAFGRRSMYRQNAVHGMLPVLFISALKLLNNFNRSVSFQNLSGKFLKPSFPADNFSLFSTIVSIDSETSKVELEYLIKNVESGTVLTTGDCLLHIKEEMLDHESAEKKNSIRPKNPLVVDSLEQRSPCFEEISRGEESQFRFVMSEESTYRLFSILKKGLPANYEFEFASWAVYCDVGNLLAMALFSTFVGMCIPGKYGTFIDFLATFKKSIKKEREYILKGHVDFKSVSTTSIVEKMSIYDSESEANIYISGKLNAKVNDPPSNMPSVEILKNTAVDLQLDGKVVLITGGSRGIGETTAKLFSLHGAKVVINYFKGREEASKIVEEIANSGGEAISIGADVSDREQVRQMVELICKKYGTVHILVNNAVRDALPFDFLKIRWEDLQKDIDITVKGAFNCCQEVIPLLLKNNYGKIINISTVFTDAPVPFQTKYIVAKSGLVGLTRALAIEFAPYNIQINLVTPSLVETDLTKHISRVFLKGMENDTPMRRHATSIDVARAVVFLASSLASFTTGQKIMVTGGNIPFL